MSVRVACLILALASERGRLDLAETVTLANSDRRPGAREMGQTIAAKGRLTVTVRDIVVAVVTKSDNTASDWPLRRIGGPRAVAETLRSLNRPGIDVSRYELEFSADSNGFCCVSKMTPFSLEKYAAAIEAWPEAVRIRAAKAHEGDPRDSATPVGFAVAYRRYGSWGGGPRSIAYGFGPSAPPPN